MPKIVLFGATGYTGELTARALAGRGLRPVLAARSQARVSALAAELGLDYATADVHSPRTVHRLVERGDVLVTTVGPFGRYGLPALEAAVGAGAHYLDSTGEPPFIREVFQTWGPRARDAGSALLTAMGYDYVPGNLAGALALQDAGPAATSLHIGYFIEGPARPGGMSGGTIASASGVILDAGHTFADGRLRTERNGRRVRHFDVAGRSRPGLSLGATEQFTLPRLHPQLGEVDVYLGWFGAASRALSLLSAPGALLFSVPPARTVARAALARLLPGSTGGPSAEERPLRRGLAVAEARDDDGRLLSRVVLEGGDPYEFTAALLAWAAERCVDGAVSGTGALGPVEAFGLDELVDGAHQAGMVVTEP